MTTLSIRTWAKAIAYWCARALQLQLFLTLFSLPILVAWGLPISLVSPLGNCLFTPFLAIFLLLSSLLFFGQLLHVPCLFFASLLNYVTDSWIALMHYGTTTWLVGITRLSMPLLFVIGITPFCIIAYRPTRSLMPSIGCFLALLVSIYVYARITAPSTQVTTIPCARGQLTLIITPQATILIDPGYLGSMVSASSWVRYKLIPLLISQTGTTHIHQMIMLQPMGLGFEAVEQLCTLLRVDSLYIPYWYGILKPSHLRRYAKLQNMTAITGTQIVRIDSIEKMVLAPAKIVTIMPQHQQIHTGNITFQALAIQIQIDNDTITLYSAKYMTPNKKSHYKRRFQQK